MIFPHFEKKILLFAQIVNFILKIKKIMLKSFGKSNRREN